MPVLEVDGVQIGQTIAINSFLARKAGLTGANEVEFALAEAIVDYLRDFHAGKFRIFELPFIHSFKYQGLFILLTVTLILHFNTSL